MQWNEVIGPGASVVIGPCPPRSCYRTVPFWQPVIGLSIWHVSLWHVSIWQTHAGWLSGVKKKSCVSFASCVHASYTEVVQ